MTRDVTFVLFGATGHLARTKLIPALARTIEAMGVEKFILVGVGARTRTDDDLRELVARALVDAGISATTSERFLAAPIAYESVVDGGFDRLTDTVTRLERMSGLSGNRVLYLAVPPSDLDPTVTGIAQCGLARSEGWIRLVVEKPFGVDLAT
ncbi:MAG: glucose-6-phosphate dehydrogenase, partial [Acidimicrobiia bacterium]|nr:glucose-6-phosphate dehydrogenase [Acidimicrobiia bacterium]